uniref:Putative secreted protein n=1 Tax=Ixodes ricinus TaxID=34613 RepID=A0A6B0V042_IXORI
MLAFHLLFDLFADLLLQFAQFILFLQQGQCQEEALRDVGLLENLLQLVRFGSSKCGSEVREVDGVVHHTLASLDHLLDGLAVEGVEGNDVSDRLDYLLRHCLHLFADDELLVRNVLNFDGQHRTGGNSVVFRSHRILCLDACGRGIGRRCCCCIDATTVATPTPSAIRPPGGLLFVGFK